MAESICAAHASVNKHINAYASGLRQVAVMRSNDQALHDATAEWVTRTVQKGFPHVTALGAAAGVPQSSLSRLFQRPDYVLSAASLRKLAAVSEVPPPPIIKNMLDRVPGFFQERIKTAVTQRHGIPLWGLHPVSSDGEFRLNPVSMQSLQRPSGIAASDKVIAFYAPDETMAPRWAEGEIVLIDLMRGATAGDYALITLLATPDNPNDTETAYFRRLGGRSGGKLHVSALDPNVPPKSFPVDRIAQVRRALAWSDIVR